MLEINLHPDSKSQRAMAKAAANWDKKARKKRRRHARRMQPSNVELLEAITSENITYLMPPAWGTLIGSLTGEALDHLPYFSRALPEGLAALTGLEPAYNNLDKPGAVVGLGIGLIYIAGHAWRRAR